MVSHTDSTRVTLPTRFRRSVPQFDATDVSFVVTLAVVGTYVFLFDLGSYTLAGWDEGVYATAAYHAVADGYWLVPHTHWIANNQHVAMEPFLHKPPLVIWLEALSMSVFGINEFAARLPSALAAVGTGLLIYAVGRRIRGKLTGLLGAIVWYTTPGVFAVTNGGRFAATDTTFVFFGTLFVVLAWAALSNDRRWLLVPTCLAAALAVMAKGFAAGIFLLVVLPLVVRHWRPLFSREMAVGVAGFALVALPWPLLVTALYGDAFLQQALIQQVIGRAAGSEGVTTGGGTFGFMRYPYFRHFPSLFAPWAYWLIPAIGVVAGLSHRRGNDARLGAAKFLTYWAAVVIGFFALFGNHQWYVMPMYVPCAILVGWLFHEVAEWTPLALVGAVAGTGLLVLFSPRFASLSPLASSGFHGLPGGVWSNYVGGLPFLGLLVAFLVVLLAGRAIRDLGIRLPAHDRTMAVAPVVLGILLVTSFVSPPASMGTLLHNQAEMGKTVRGASPANETVYVQTHIPDASNLFPYEFYSRRSAASANRLQLYTNDSIEYALVEGSTLQTLRRPHEVLAKKNVQSGNGPKTVAAVHFTGTFDEYDPAPNPVRGANATGNLLANPRFESGLSGWWIPTGDNETVVSLGHDAGDPVAIMAVPEDGEPLPIAQAIPTLNNHEYRIDVNASGAVDAALFWYDGEKRPDNLVARRNIPARELPATVTANGSTLSLRLQPVDDRVTVHSANVTAVEDDRNYVRVGRNVVRNGNFGNGLSDWWHNTGSSGTQVSVHKGTVKLHTSKGQEPLPLAQQIVVDDDERYWVHASTDGYADVMLVWFEDANASDPLAVDVVPATDTPRVVEAKSSLVAVRVMPADRTVNVESVSLYRIAEVDAVTNRTATPDR